MAIANETTLQVLARVPGRYALKLLGASAETGDVLRYPNFYWGHRMAVKRANRQQRTEAGASKNRTQTAKRSRSPDAIGARAVAPKKPKKKASKRVQTGPKAKPSKPMLRNQKAKPSKSALRKPAKAARQNESERRDEASPDLGRAHAQPATRPICGRIWHISDLHWSIDAPPGQAGGELSGLPKEALAIDIHADLMRLAEREKGDVLVVNGDLVVGREAAGDPSGAKRDAAFTASLGLVRRLANALGLGDQTKTRVVICPGNHDVDRTPGGGPDDALEVFRQATEEFITPFSPSPWLWDPTIGIALHAINTSRYGATPLSVGSTPLPTSVDRPVFDLARLDGSIATQSEMRDGQLPLTVLGIAVAHHPFTIAAEHVPQASLITQPLAGAKAQEKLQRAGFGVFLHGHRHQGLGRIERTYDERARRRHAVTLGAPRFGEGPGESGLQVIDYAMSPRTGEARLIVRPYAITSSGMEAQPSYCLSVPARGRSSARLVKILERIEPSADSRTDVAYFDVPVRVRGTKDVAPGWQCEQGDALVRRFPRLVQTPGAPTGAARVLALDDHCSAKTTREQVLEDDGVRHWSTEVTVRNATVESVSFLERTWSNTAYALTREHLRRIWGGRSSPLPDLDSSEPYENIRHVLRDPADSLEFFVRFPFALENNPRIDVRTYVEEIDAAAPGVLRDVPAPEFLEFSRIRIERMLFIKRLRVVIEHPITGVEYALVWWLPTERQAGQRSLEGDARQIIEDAETLRKNLITFVGRERMPRFRKPIRDFLIKKVVKEAARLGNETAEDLEWALFVPSTPLTDVTSEGKEGMTRPELVAVLASFERDDETMSIRWKAGVGLAGRAYANGTTEMYSSAASPPRDPWHTPNVETYVKKGRRSYHRYLAAFPIRREVSGRAPVEGVFCVGTRKASSSFDLSGTATSNTGAGERKAEVLAKALAEWARFASDSLPGD